MMNTCGGVTCVYIVVPLVIARVARVVAQCLDEKLVIVNAEGVDDVREGPSRRGRGRRHFLFCGGAASFVIGGDLQFNPISQVTEILAPLIRSGKKIECNLLRHTLSPYISSEVILDDVAIRSILRGVCREMQAGNYKAPEPIIGANELKAFTSVDISSMNCGKVLDELLSNFNTNGDNSWIVTRLMQRLKADDPYFDFRLHTDENDHVGSWRHYLLKRIMP